MTLGPNQIAYLNHLPVYTSEYMPEGKGVVFETHCRNCGELYNPMTPGELLKICWMSHSRKHEINMWMVDLKELDSAKSG